MPSPLGAYSQGLARVAQGMSTVNPGIEVMAWFSHISEVFTGLSRRLPAALLLAVVSCLGGALLEERSCPEGYVEVKLGDCGVNPLTKGTLLAGCEDASSGAFVAVYRSDTGVFECAKDVAPGVTFLLREGFEYDFFLLGNLNYIRQDNGQVSNLRAALGDDFPEHRSELVGFDYMLDGGNVGSSIWRRESSADIVSYGIPYSGFRMGVTAEELKAEGELTFSDVSYLFAKVEVTVDHSQLDYGIDAAEDWFRNMTLSVRQANGRLYPFSSSAPAAKSSADIVGGVSDPMDTCFDYEASMVNGSQVTYVLYLPANVQGVLLEGNMDPSRKTPEGLEGAGEGEKAGLCSFVEFTGAVSVVPGGFRGDLRYRFFLGLDSCSDFSVLPGRSYHVSLVLSVEGVFGAVWKVSGSLVDQRVLRLFRDGSRAQELPYGGTLSLCAGRAAEAFVRCDDGSGRDLMYSSSFDGIGWTPRGLDDFGLRCSFWDVSDGDAVWLSECGIVAAWDRARRCLVFTVDDEALFAGHVGERRLLEVYGVPGDGGCWRSFTLELVDFASVSAGGYRFVVKPSYVGTSSVLRHERDGMLPASAEEVSVSVDGAYLGDYGLLSDGDIDLGVLSEGVHEIGIEVVGVGGEQLLAEVCAVPAVSVTFGRRSLQTTCWKKVRDADGRPYVVHRRSWGRIWVDFQPQGRYESMAVRMTGGAGSLYSVSGTVADINSSGIGEGEILLDFSLGDSVCTVSVPYVSYEEVVFRAAEEHGWLVLINNNVSVGWESFENSVTGTLYASVRWALRLTLRCSDGSSVSGRWGPFTDTSVTVADGSRHLRNFHDEFKTLRQSFESGHRLQDADRLEGEMSFRVSFGSRYYLANVSGSTFADFSGMVEAVCETSSAHPLLQHWGANSSWFYGLR